MASTGPRGWTDDLAVAELGRAARGPWSRKGLAVRTMTAIGLALVLSLIGGIVLGTLGTLALLLVDWVVES